MMMENTEEYFPWHQSGWLQLSAYIRQQRIPQSLLISGPKGLGKEQLAYHFAKSLICEQRTPEYYSCNQCRSCHLFNARTYPDFSVIEPEESGKNIGINQIRELIDFLTLKSVNDAYRIVIINEAELMSNAAANSFLKCLEEPVEQTSIILITDKPALLPATIISRCQKLKIASPDPNTTKSWLQQQKIFGDLDMLICLTNGAPLIARSIADSESLTQRIHCFKAWLQIAHQQQNPISVAEQWLQISDAMLLFWLTTWVIDLIKCYHHQNAVNFYNPDLFQDLQELAQRLELKGLFNYYQLLLRQKKHLSTQLNKHLIFEELLINWSKITRVR